MPASLEVDPNAASAERDPKVTSPEEASRRARGKLAAEDPMVASLEVVRKRAPAGCRLRAGRDAGRPNACPDEEARFVWPVPAAEEVVRVRTEVSRRRRPRRREPPSRRRRRTRSLNPWAPAVPSRIPRKRLPELNGADAASKRRHDASLRKDDRRRTEVKDADLVALSKGQRRLDDVVAERYVVTRNRADRDSSDDDRADHHHRDAT